MRVHSSSVFFILDRMSLIVAFILKTELYVFYQTVANKAQLATGKKNKRTKTISNNKKWDFIKTFKEYVHESKGEKYLSYHGRS